MSNKNLTYNHDVYSKFLKAAFHPLNVIPSKTELAAKDIAPNPVVIFEEEGESYTFVLENFYISYINDLKKFKCYIEDIRSSLCGLGLVVNGFEEVNHEELRKMLFDGFNEKEKAVAANSEIVQVDVNELYLDILNPRLPKGIEKSEKEILKYIATSTSLEDLMEAIAKNGFFPGEPLVAVKEGGKLVVVEGNRRLSAVKLLNNPDCIANAGKAIKAIADSCDIIESLPVVIRDNRAQVLPYLGFRHITGVKQWEPLSKARYMRELFLLTDDKEEPGERYRKVAQMIGSRSNHIKRSLDALAVYEEIEEQEFYEIPGLTEESIKFAVLSTALADERIASFVGTVEKNGRETQHTHPIVEPNCLSKASIKDLTNWLYKKNEHGVTRVGESRNLKRLGAILDSEKAKHAFMGGSSLDYAFRLSKGSEEEFMEFLYNAQASLAQASSLVANIDFSEQALDVSREIQSNIKLIGKTLSAKKVDDDDF